MTNPTQDPLVERLRNAAHTTGCEPDVPQYLANLYQEAADEIAHLTAEMGAFVDPPHRALLLAQLDEWLRLEESKDPRYIVGQRFAVEHLKEVIAVIRTEAQLREITRNSLKDWHTWARKVARAGTDEYADAMPAALQTKIVGRVEAGELALRILPIRRRVELVQALCADIGLGAEEAGELAPRAALWTDAEITEIEAFRARDWTGLNPFDHLPAALERTMYPGPGGRRAFLKRIGDPLPEYSKPEGRQLGLPGLPKPETAMRLRLALIDRPDGLGAALVASFAQQLLEKLDGMQEDALWTSSEQADRLCRRVRQVVEAGDPVTVAAFCAFAWHNGWSLAGGQSDLAALHAVLTGLLNAEPALDLEVFPIDPATGEYKLEGEGGLEMAARLLTIARQRGAFDRSLPAELPSPEGYTPWVSMGNSGWALNGVRVADDVLGAWAHAWRLPVWSAQDLRKLVEAVARRARSERIAFDSGADG